MRSTILIWLVIAAACIIAGCSGSEIPQAPTAGDELANVKLEDAGLGLKGSADVPDEFEDPTPDDKMTWDLIAGQKIFVGTTGIWHDGENIYVDLSTVNGWMLCEAHVYIGVNPPAKGAPGQFPYKAEMAEPTDYYMFGPIPLQEVWGPKSSLYFAVHAVVCKDDQEETAWAGEYNEEGESYFEYKWPKKWGGFFDACIAPIPDLPEEPVGYQVDRWGTTSYFDVFFDDQDLDLPPGEFIGPNGVSYVGWCADLQNPMTEFNPFLATLYSSYDPDIPVDPSIPCSVLGNWEFINYMVNQRRKPTPGGPFDGIDWTIQDNYLEFQRAMWYFSDNMAISTPLAEALVLDTIANGDNYVPCEGDWYTLLLWPDTTSDDPLIRAQLVVIEVDP